MSAGIAVRSLHSGPCLRGLDLAVARGERVALLAPNGAGKTTLLRAIAGLMIPERGSADAEGPIGWVPQSYRQSLLPWLSARGNVALPLEALGLTRERAALRVEEVTAELGLGSELLDRRPATLSGGEQQLVALARALVRAPRTLLLDEPFSALDVVVKARAAAAVVRHAEESGAALLLVSHDLHDASRIATRLMVMTRRPLRTVCELPSNAPLEEITRALGRGFEQGGP